MSFFDGCNDVGDFDRIFKRRSGDGEKKGVDPFSVDVGMLLLFFPKLQAPTVSPKRQKTEAQRCLERCKKNASDVWAGSFCFLKLPECQSVSLVGLGFFSKNLFRCVLSVLVEEGH